MPLLDGLDLEEVLHAQVVEVLALLLEFPLKRIDGGLELMVGAGEVLETILELAERLPSEVLRLVQLQVRTAYLVLLTKSLEVADPLFHLGKLICLDLVVDQLVDVLANKLCANIDLPEHCWEIVVSISAVTA